MSISIQNLSKSFGATAVFNNFSAELPETGIVCLRGASGSGKTTLLRILAGLEKAESGTVSGLDGKKIAFVFQEDRLLPQCSALENVSLVSSESEALFWLGKLGLSQELDKKPTELSGGMCRRVATARALAYRGDILLLDEPFKGLDAELKETLFKILRDVSKKALVILVTHEQSEADIADKTISVEGL
jgi:NitT/TauT family transport system ATP-binding protein